MVQIMMRLHNFFKIACYRIIEIYILGKGYRLKNDGYGGDIVKKIARVLSMTIIATIGLAACGQTSTEQKKTEGAKEQKNEHQKEMKMNHEAMAPKEMNANASSNLRKMLIKSMPT